MPLIVLETFVAAPLERVFDLARSVEAHTASTGKTAERVVAGRDQGLFEAGEEVTWEARHFGVRQRLVARITELEFPRRFADEMVQGAFAEMRHEHLFRPEAEGTLMRDEFFFRAPLGLLGRLAEGLFLTAYLRKFLLERNAVLKALAESERWREFLA